MQFTYEAKTSDGRTISGSVEADDERSAAGQLRAQGHFPMRLRPVRRIAGAGAFAQSSVATQAPPVAAPPGMYPAPQQTVPGQNEVTAYPGAIGAPPVQTMEAPTAQAWYQPQAEQSAPFRANPLQWLWDRLFKQLFSQINPFELAAAYRQFGALLGAGVPMSTTLDTIGAETASPELRKAIDRMRPEIRAGGTLSDAMRHTPWVFPASHRAMIVPGEVTGNLDVVFYRLADMVESEHRLRLKLKREMVQPVITIGGTFLLPPLFFLFVGKADLYITTAVLPFLACLLIAGGIWVATRLMSQFRVMWDTFVASLPTVGKIVHMLTVARFCRMLGMLINSGVGVSAAINYAADACGNVYLSWRMRKVAGFVEAGYPIVDGFTATRVFPPLVVSMMGTGELTGKVDAMMQKVAEYYEAEADVAMHKAVQSFTALMTLVIGAIVLIICAQFYTGYFNGLLSDTNGN